MRTSTTTLFTFIVFLSYANVQRPQADRKTTRVPNETKRRNTDHIDEILLRPDPIGYDDNDPNIQAVLKELRTIYQNAIRPVEKQFRYADLRRHTMSDVDIYAKPIILLVGPWSTGKSTMINYLLGIEGALESLYVGAEPTTGDFTVLSYGEEYRTVEGVVLATDATKPFASMEKFGQIFLEHLLGVEMNIPLLRNVSFIDTPGILENRRQQERGYPYNDVMRWLVHRSDLIFVVFDPTKLDVGYELETLFKQLKGKESVLRIILNKADSMSEQDLMRVYGALFWSLSPLINVTEPPRVYVGSFWGEPYHDDDLAEILLREEKSLLHDMREVIRNRVYNKIAFVRQYAIRVRIHALLVDSYVTAYRRNKGLFGGSDELARQIVEDPESYDVFKTVLGHPNISKYDLPEPEEYEEFFRINPLPDQRRISEHCGYFSGCALDKLNQAISNDLPLLLRRFRTPNERRGQKRGLERQGDFAEWHREHEMKKKAEAAAAAGQKPPGNGASAETVQTSAGGSKKYRKSSRAEQEQVAPASDEVEETPQAEPEIRRKGRPAKVKEPKSSEVRSSKLSGRSKERSGEEGATPAKEPTKRKRRTKERVDSGEAEAQAKIPEPEPEPESPPVPQKVEIPQVEPSQEPPSSEPESQEEEEEVEEPPPPPPPPVAKSSKKTTGTKSKEPPSKPVSPKFQASAKASREASEAKVSEERASKEETSGESEEQESSQETTGHKGTTVAPEGTKCKFRKNCKEGVESSTPPPNKTPEVPHKGSPKKSGETEKKKLAPKQPPKQAPQPSPPPSSAPGVKCNKFRKSCQEGQTAEAPSGQPQRKAAEAVPKSAPASPAAAPATRCQKYAYRKSCGSGQPEGAAPAKSVEKPKGKESPPIQVVSAPVSEGKKCNKFRKSCQESDVSEDETPKKTASVADDHPPKETVKHVHAPGAPVKCNKFRKSCQQAMESGIVAEPVDQRRTKAEEEHEPVVVQKVHCGKYSYRISCREQRENNEDEDEEEEEKERVPSSKKAEEKRPEVKTAAPPSYVAPEGGKCNKFRKSCQQQAEEPPAAKVPKTEAKSESKPVKASEPQPSAPVVQPGGKCNKFRKSCQAAMEANPAPVQRVTEKRETVSSPEPVVTAPIPCTKYSYRKSCRDAQATESDAKTAKVKATPAAKEEVKPKKLCKKNATAASPGGKKEQQKKAPKAAPAPAPAQVQQNKWRKPKTPPAEQLMSS